MQHKKMETGKKWRWKSVAQINEQCYILKNNATVEKYNRSKASKQGKRLLKMYIKTKFYVNQTI